MRFAETRSGQTRESLWMSGKAVLDGTKAIRGGVPVIFPQFSGLGPMASHGFARTSVWELVSSSTTDSSVDALFRLEPNAASAAMWGKDKKFRFDYRVTLALPASPSAPCSVTLSTRVTNTGESSFEYNMALHSYFPVSDITAASVVAGSGASLRGVRYVDQLKKEGKVRADKIVEQGSDAIEFDREVDRIYLGVPANINVVDSKAQTAIAQSHTFTDAVVWNPWIAKSKRMSDFGDEEYKGMLCVEVAEIGAAGNAVKLAPKATAERATTIFAASAQQ